MGSFECSLAHCSERSAAVYGSGGVIEVPFPFWCPTEIRVTTMVGKASQKWDGPVVHNFPLPENIRPLPGATATAGGNNNNNDEHSVGFNFVNSEGLAYEAMEVNRCIREELTETPKFTSAQCLDIMRIISEIDAMSRSNSN